MTGKVVVMIPSVTNKPVVGEVIRTFGSDVRIKIIHLTDIVVNNYASDELNAMLNAQIRSNIESWYANQVENEDVFVVLTGGILQAIIAVRALDALGIPYNFLVYEKKLKRYVTINSDGFLDHSILEKCCR